jgi:hypothetical protein
LNVSKPRVTRYVEKRAASMTVDGVWNLPRRVHDIATVARG